MMGSTPAGAQGFDDFFHFAGAAFAVHALAAHHIK